MLENQPLIMFKCRHEAGICELCGYSVSRLERHHIHYKPERTIKLCHGCHFKVHFRQWLLTDRQLEILLLRIYKADTVIKYKHNLMSLLTLSHSHYGNQSSTISPSRKAFLEAEKDHSKGQESKK